MRLGTKKLESRTGMSQRKKSSNRDGNSAPAGHDDDFEDVFACSTSEQSLCKSRKLPVQEVSNFEKQATARTDRVAKCSRMQLKALAKLHDLIERQIQAVDEENFLVGEDSPLRKQLPSSSHMNLMAALHEKRDSKWKKRKQPPCAHPGQA